MKNCLVVRRDRLAWHWAAARGGNPEFLVDGNRRSALGNQRSALEEASEIVRWIGLEA